MEKLPIDFEKDENKKKKEDNSEIEIMPQAEKKQSKIYKYLFADWKKDWQKIKKILIFLMVCVLIIEVVLYLAGDFLGFRFDLNLKKLNFKEYNHLAPDFNFKYPDYFTIDNGEGKSYGDTYLAGIKLSTDPRVGCDFRTIGSGLNFEKSDQEIKNALVEEMSKNAKDFSLVSGKRIKVGGQKAYSLEFTFTDPINSKTRLNQIMTTSNGMNYLIICGAGDYQYSFFEPDFQAFIKSIKWKSNLKLN